MDYDSDDTDVLLLIPPDYFLINSTNSTLSTSPDLTQIPKIGCSECEETLRSSKKLSYICQNCNQLIIHDLTFGNQEMSQQQNHQHQHYHLEPKQQSELDRINERLSKIETNLPSQNDTELSSISNSTVITNLRDYVCGGIESNENYSNSSIIHSTPKLIDYAGEKPKFSKIVSENSSKKELFKYPNSQPNLINEIDNFFDKKSFNFGGTNSEPISLPTQSSTNNFVLGKSSRFSDWNINRNLVIDNNDLISLSELWENNPKNKNSNESTSGVIQEERLRRQHCEKLIQQLQIKLLEYQQKMSIALEVDKSKDAALEKHRNENFNLKERLTKCEEKLNFIELQKDELYRIIKCENDELKCSKDCLEKELSQALSMAAKFQDRNDVLEGKVDNLSKATNEVSAVYKKQLDDMELKVANFQRCEEFANEELAKLKNRLAQSEHDGEKAMTELSELKKQFNIIQSEKRINLEKLRKETTRLGILEKENKNLNDLVAQLSSKEKVLQRELENQRSSLKTYYQQQLENVVDQKLKEFQSQLDKVEENLRKEAKDREILIADRAIKQLELINEKNEQEISLLIEKQNEEIKIYRIQLINASKKINDLMEKLNLYRNRRVDIAEKLHDVMETQWQKALEILTNPSEANAKRNETLNLIDSNKDVLDGTSKKTENGRKSNPENDNFNFNTPAPKNFIEKECNNSRLASYIELLLSKSPRDLDELDEILAMPKDDEYNQDRFMVSGHHNQKPPWK